MILHRIAEAVRAALGNGPSLLPELAERRRA